MIQNALHILGPVSATHLDPILLAESQPKGLVGYVLTCLEEPEVSDEYDMLCFDGEEWVDGVRLTPEGRSFIRIDDLREEYSRINRGALMIHLFMIDSSLMCRFLATVRHEPCFKIRIDTLRRRQLEMLVRTYGSQDVLAERNDFTTGTPRMELQPVLPGQPLPSFAMGYGRGEFLLYRCPGERRVFASGAIPNEFSGYQEADQTFEDQRRILVSRRRLLEAARRSVPSTSLPADPVPGPEHLQRGAHITLAGTFVDIVRDTSGPRLARANRAGTSAEAPYQLELLSGSKLPENAPSPATSSSKGNAPSPATSSSRGNTASSAAKSPGGSAHVRDEPIPEIAGLLQQLVDAFRTQTISILGKKGQVVFESCERELRKQAPQFRSDEIDDDTAILAVDLIDAVVREAPLLKRSKLRRITLALIADLYNKHFEVLNRRGLIPRVEEVYFAHKK